MMAVTLKEAGLGSRAVKWAGRRKYYTAGYTLYIILILLYLYSLLYRCMLGFKIGISNWPLYLSLGFVKIYND